MSRLRVSLIFAGLVVSIDQILKVWVQGFLKLGMTRAIFPPIFYLSYVENTGSVWGIFQKGYILLGCLGCVALVLLFCLHRQFNLQYRWNAFFFGLLTGGIIGNTIDRFRLGYVIDFLDFRFGRFSWPVFNIADAALTVSVVYFILHSLFKANRLKD